MEKPDAIIATLKALHAAEARCTRCPLYKDATQVVPGEGPANAKLMLVGEQLGDREDLAGRPFVGPAGQLLDRALEAVGIDRDDTFVTNAVKHFKFEPRGKRRIHKRPNQYEVERCKWWQDIERRLVKPKLIVALGATAARSLLGRVVTISKTRGEILTTDDGEHVAVTIHPSALLRITDQDERQREYGHLVDDLRECARFLQKAA
jgi:uracil-DNA glycosylase family protein